MVAVSQVSIAIALGAASRAYKPRRPRSRRRSEKRVHTETVAEPAPGAYRGAALGKLRVELGRDPSSIATLEGTRSQDPRAALRTKGRHPRCRPLRPAEGRPQSPQSAFDFLHDPLPRDPGRAIPIEFVKSPIKLSSLPVGKRHSVRVRGKTVPYIFKQAELLFWGQVAEIQRWERHNESIRPTSR